MPRVPGEFVEDVADCTLGTIQFLKHEFQLRISTLFLFKRFDRESCVSEISVSLNKLLICLQKRTVFQ